VNSSKARIPNLFFSSLKGRGEVSELCELLWRHWVLSRVIAFRGYGIEVEIILEHYTSKERSICCEVHEKRVHRGLYICNTAGGKINADVNAALNIARRIGYEIGVMRDIESYLVIHNGVKPLIPNRRGRTP